MFTECVYVKENKKGVLGVICCAPCVFIFFQPGHASTPKGPIRALSVILHCSYQLNCMCTSINVCVRRANSM